MALDNPPIEGRFLSEELGKRLYDALREKILKQRAETTSRCQEEERASTPENDSDSDCHDSVNTLEEVTSKIKEKINQLAYMKKVKRGMLLHLQYMKDQEVLDPPELNNIEVADDDIPVKRRKRAKSRALTARKGTRRVGQGIRRRPSFSPSHSIAKRLRRRSLPNKG